MKTIFRLSFLLLLSMACKSTTKVADKTPVVPKKIDKMNFQYNEEITLTEVVDKAIASDKLVFVDFYTDWCTPCKLMDEDVFSDKDMTDFMKANFINYKVDGEKYNGPNLGLMFGVAGFPTLLILDQKGRILERHDGALYHSGLKEMALRALDQNKS